MTHIVKSWLEKDYNVIRFGDPTWRDLVKAVGHPDGGADMVLAMEIAERHKARGMSRVLVAVPARNQILCMSLCISSASPSLKHCSVELMLRVGFIVLYKQKHK